MRGKLGRSPVMGGSIDINFMRRGEMKKRKHIKKERIKKKLRLWGGGFMALTLQETLIRYNKLFEQLLWCVWEVKRVDTLQNPSFEREFLYQTSLEVSKLIQWSWTSYLNLLATTLTQNKPSNMKILSLSRVKYTLSLLPALVLLILWKKSLQPLPTQNKSSTTPYPIDYPTIVMSTLLGINSRNLRPLWLWEKDELIKTMTHLLFFMKNQLTTNRILMSNLVGRNFGCCP